MKSDEVFNKIVEYLYKKNIDTYIDRDSIVWIFKHHYTEFKVTVYLNTYSYNKPTFKFYANFTVNSLKKKRVTYSENNNSYLYKIYNILAYAKTELEKIGNDDKIEKDLSKKYCSELEKYYNRKHKSVSIYSNNSYSDRVIVSVYGYDVDKSTSYNIEIRDKKYFLKYKSINLKKVIKMSSLK